MGALASGLLPFGHYSNLLWVAPWFWAQDIPGWSYTLPGSALKLTFSLWSPDTFWWIWAQGVLLITGVSLPLWLLNWTEQGTVYVDFSVYIWKTTSSPWYFQYNTIFPIQYFQYNNLPRLLALQYLYLSEEQTWIPNQHYIYSFAESHTTQRTVSEYHFGKTNLWHRV